MGEQEFLKINSNELKNDSFQAQHVAYVRANGAMATIVRLKVGPYWTSVTKNKQPKIF